MAIRENRLEIIFTVETLPLQFGKFSKILARERFLTWEVEFIPIFQY